MSGFLALLRQQGRIQEEPEPLNPDSLRDTKGRMAPVERQWRPGGEFNTPRAKPASWKKDLHVPLLPCRRIIMTLPGTKTPFVQGGLPPDARIEDLRKNVEIYLKPGPHTHLIIEHHGKMLLPEQTLVECCLQDDAKLSVRLVERRPTGDRGLRRLRVSCSALTTRSIEIEQVGIRGAQFKELLEQCLGRPGANGPAGTYDFWDSEGQLKRIVGGQTVLAVADAAAVEDGTSEVTLGEELIMDSFQSSSLRGGKGTVTAIRMATGKPAVISAEMVAFLDLKPPDMRLTFGGVDIKDNDALYALGCRTDDIVHLEFESPTVPPILTLLRAPPSEKPAKKEKSGKKKK